MCVVFVRVMCVFIYVCIYLQPAGSPKCQSWLDRESFRLRHRPGMSTDALWFIACHTVHTGCFFCTHICPLNLRGNVCIHLASASHIRKTPVHKLYSSQRGQQLQSVGPTKGPVVLSQLPQGFHHLYTHIEYECASQFYQHSGSSRRTCLKTGKWSGLHVSCSPGEGSRGPPVFQSVDSLAQQTHWHTF